MTRRQARDRDRSRTALAIGASIAVHALVLTTVSLELPVFGADETPRPLRLVELPEEWRRSALEVVPLETAAAPAPVTGSTGAAAPTSTTPPATREPEPSAQPLAIALPGAPRPAATSPSLDLTRVEKTTTPTARIAASRTARGIIQRADAGPSARPALRFTAASQAARDAEEDGEDGHGARPGRGIGISISGPGACPTSGDIPAIGIGGGLGGLPTSGKGMGIIGARPPNRGAINRAAPPIGGAR